MSLLAASGSKELSDALSQRMSARNTTLLVMLGLRMRLSMTASKFSASKEQGVEIAWCIGRVVKLWEGVDWR